MAKIHSMFINRVSVISYIILTLSPGVPDGSGLRSTCWKILLNYLPFCTSDWDDVLTKQRNAYNQFIRTMIVDPNQSQDISDHPLSTSTNSTWSEYFKENEVLSQIDKDVRRLCPDLSFFQQPTKFPASFCSQSLRTRVEQVNINIEPFFLVNSITCVCFTFWDIGCM